MSKLRTIIRHEYLKRVGTWAFVISTVLGPLLIGLPAIPIFLSTLDLRESTRLAVVDQSGKSTIVCIEKYGKRISIPEVLRWVRQS